MSGARHSLWLGSALLIAAAAYVARETAHIDLKDAGH